MKKRKYNKLRSVRVSLFAVLAATLYLVLGLPKGRILHRSENDAKSYAQISPACVCPSFGLVPDLLKNWLMTPVVTEKHLDIKRIRNLPKSRVPVSHNFLRLKIIKHKLYISGLKFKKVDGKNVSIGVPPTYIHFASLFLNVLVNSEYGDIPDIEVLINTAACGTDMNPGIMTHARIGGPALLPSDYETMCVNIGMVGYEASEVDFSKSSAWPVLERIPRRPWKNKIDKAVWRGSCTGVKDNYFQHVRFRVAEVGNSNSDVFDTKLIRTGPCRKNMGSEQTRVDNMFAKQELLERQYLKFENMLDYKLAIDANGDCKNSQRFSKLLLAGSVVLKSLGHSNTFITRLMKPWKHYIPFDESANDLASLTREILAKPRYAEDIVNSALDEVSRILSPHGMVCYMRELILSYSKLLSFMPVLTSDDVPISVGDSDLYFSSTTIPLRGWPNLNLSNVYTTRCGITKIRKIC